nr:undecaprenyldiphospho-muramoylpentapeptide beta-N-acetylglucosaminyltransferase [candidate division Zixibacteria bacterium]
MKQLRLIFAGGGTGGHLFPALAIANHLKKRIEPENRAEFRFIGTRRGIEFRLKDSLGYSLTLISVRGLYRKGVLRNLLFPLLLIGATIKSMFICWRFKPDAVIGTGGYVMGPVMMGAVFMRKGCFIQEQNSYPGLTTRQLAHRVDCVFLGFGEARKHLDGRAVTIETGNPVKDIIGKIDRNEARRHFGFNDNDHVILILGGSQGATSVNQNILDHLHELPNDFKLIWQTGERDYKEIAAAAGGRVGSRALFAFTDQIEQAYAAADLAIARSGALTLAELEAAGLPAVLIPYPHATADHQRKNAETFESKGAAVVIFDHELPEVSLIKGAVEIIRDGSWRKMKEAIDRIRTSRKKPAVEAIADEILSMIGWEGSRT